MPVPLGVHFTKDLSQEPRDLSYTSWATSWLDKDIFAYIISFVIYEIGILGIIDDFRYANRLGLFGKP